MTSVEFEVSVLPKAEYWHKTDLNNYFMQHEGQSELYEDILDYMNMIFTGLFTVECLLKLFAFRVKVNAIIVVGLCNIILQAAYEINLSSFKLPNDFQIVTLTAIGRHHEVALLNQINNDFNLLLVCCLFSNIVQYLILLVVINIVFYSKHFKRLL